MAGLKVDESREMDSASRRTFAKIRALLKRDVPVGVIQMFAGSTAPTNWGICNGAAMSRTAFADLFALIGTTYGAGDGSTTFNIPNMQGRSPIGVGTGAGLTARTLGTFYGEENHLLLSGESGMIAQVTTTVSADHTHSFSGTTGNQNANHTHSPGGTGSAFLQNGAGDGGGANITTGGAGYALNSVTATDNQNHGHSFSGTTGGISANHTHSTTAANAAAGHNTIHPVMGINYIIKLTP